MFIGTLNSGKTVEGYLEKGLLEVHNLYSRHRELVEEMRLRGYNHHSDVGKKWKNVEKLGFVDKKKNLIDLMERCPRCKQRYLENKTSK